MSGEWIVPRFPGTKFAVFSDRENSSTYLHINVVQLHDFALKHKHPPRSVKHRSVKLLLYRKRIRSYWGEGYRRVYYVVAPLVEKLNSSPLALQAIEATEGAEGVKAYAASLIRELENVD